MELEQRFVAVNAFKMTFKHLFNEMQFVNVSDHLSHIKLKFQIESKFLLM